MNQAKDGQLKVWHIPQVPMHAFEVLVETLDEARLLLDVLAQYDIFQYENNIKPDYSNANGLMQYHAEFDEWWDWESEDGETLNEYFENQDE